MYLSDTCGYRVIVVVAGGPSFLCTVQRRIPSTRIPTGRADADHPVLSCKSPAVQRQWDTIQSPPSIHRFPLYYSRQGANKVANQSPFSSSIVFSSIVFSSIVFSDPTRKFQYYPSFFFKFSKATSNHHRKPSWAKKAIDEYPNQ
ncbi:hypothetical protein Dimus_034390 [Dionaea muscipula]